MSSRCGGDQVALPLDAGKARRVQHDLGPGRHTPRGLQPLDVFRIDGVGIESPTVDAAIDDTDAVVDTRVTLFDHGGRKARIGDDPLTLRHDAVIGRLERADLAIGAVIGGDERLESLPRGEKRAPARRATPRMDEIDTPFFDQAPRGGRYWQSS